MNKWSCLQVIIDFVFEQPQPKPGHVSFVDAIQCDRTISIEGVRCQDFLIYKQSPGIKKIARLVK